jgi:hypothetical protein
MEEQKRIIAEEEAQALETPIDARIHKVEVPPESTLEFDAKVLKLQQQFPVFASREDAEYFSMLPLSRQDSIAVLQRAREIQMESEKENESWMKQSLSLK